MPRSATRAATVPVQAKYGLPTSSLRTSTSVQTSPVGAPSALAKRLLGREPAGHPLHRRVLLGRGEDPVQQARGGRRPC